MGLLKIGTLLPITTLRLTNIKVDGMDHGPLHDHVPSPT